MSPGIIALIVVVIVALAVAGLFFARPQLQRQRMRMRFGSEYDHAVQAHGSREEAERELAARVERHHKLNIRPLEPAARERYQEEWTAIQERFVEDPRAAAGEAEQLIASIMHDQGYPNEGHEQRLADLSVAHTRSTDHYRQAHTVATRAADNSASTEDLRQALMHYRALFEDLLSAHGGRGIAARDGERGRHRNDGANPDTDTDAGAAAEDDAASDTATGRKR